MKTDLASLLSALTVQPGVAAQVSVSGGLVSATVSNTAALAPAGTSMPVAASAKMPDTPARVTATAFQAALASQVQNATPPAQPAAIKPGLVAYFSTATAVSDLTAHTETSAAAAVSAAPTAPQALAPVQVTAKPITLVTPEPTIAVPAMALAAPVPVTITASATPVPATPVIASPAHAASAARQPAPLSTLIDQPAMMPVSQPTNGKLPNDGNMLPADAAPAKPRLVPAPGAARVADDAPTDDKSASPVPATDPSAQPLLALVVATAQPVLPPIPTRTSTAVTPDRSRGSAITTTATPTTTPTATPQIVGNASSPVRTFGAAAFAPAAADKMPALLSTGPIAPARSGEGNSVTPPSSPAAAPTPVSAPTPVTSVAPLPAIVAILPAIPAQSVPVSLGPPAPDPGNSRATGITEPVVVTLVAPALPDLASTITAIPSLPAATPGLSTTSRLARQSGVSRSASPDAPADNSTEALLPNVGILPVAPASAAASVAAPVTTPPQDFAALVDRLLEARASAQSATAPQQISTSVTHADFGKVSLTFQQDTGGLSVSMTSTDPGFARAAQSAIATSGQPGVGQNAPMNLVSSGHAGNQGAAGNFSQGIAPPETPVPVNAGASSHSTSFSTGSGGSQQSQPQAQPQAQPQQRPGFIAAANRTPAASGTVADTGEGIFA